MKPISAIIASAIAITAVTVWYIIALGTWSTATVQASATGPGQVLLRLDTVPAANVGPHPDWVQYQTQDINNPQSATIFKVPVNTWVTVDIHQYDSPTTLRNAFWGLVQGTKGGIAYLNGKQFSGLTPDVVSHTFAVPGLNVNVPLEGVPATAKAGSYEDVRFTFFSGSRQHVYHWQCFDPCGWGPMGNGGPMSTFGYMGGEFIVG